MAIVIPIIMAATGATTAIAGAVGLTAAIGASAAATVVSTVASVAFQVSGVNDKINKAASKVFGEDFVQIVNIAGAVYGAVNGGFDFGGGEAAGIVTDPSSLNYTNSADLLSDTFSAANAADLAAGGAGLASDGMGGIYHAPGTAGAVLDAQWRNGLGTASEYTPDGGMNSVELSAIDQGAAKGVGWRSAGANADARIASGSASSAADELANRTRATGTATSIAAAPAPMAANVSDAAASGMKAAGANAASGPQRLSVGADRPAVPKPGSFFDKLGSFATSEKGLGLLAQGVNTGLTNASKERLEREKMAIAESRYRSVSGIRVA
jgi:hypothetical protein